MQLAADGSGFALFVGALFCRHTLNEIWAYISPCSGFSAQAKSIIIGPSNEAVS